MEYSDDYTNLRWSVFKGMIADELMERKLVASHKEAEHFAESLDLSFEQDYNPVGLQHWPDLIKRDADAYEKDLNKNPF